MNREAIYQALFEKSAAIPGLLTRSRRLKHWSDVPPSEQPALFQAQRDEYAERERGCPVKWIFWVDWYVYAHAGNDADATPATLLNNILDAIEEVLKPDILGRQDLDGLVMDCRIDGKVETDEGLLGPQCVAIVPIRIIVVND